MEYLNKVEIIGTIGSIWEDPNVYRLGVATQTAKDHVIEITWLDCLIEKKNFKGTPAKGDFCHVTGRIRQSMNMDAYNNMTTTYQIVCSSGEIVSEPKKK